MNEGPYPFPKIRYKTIFYLLLFFLFNSLFYLSPEEIIRNDFSGINKGINCFISNAI